MSARRPQLAVVLLILATVTWGVSFPLIKALTLAQEAALPGRSSWFYSSLALTVRFGVSALLMLCWRPGILRGISRLEWKQAGGLAFFLAGGSALQNDALSYTHASTSAFLTQFYCVLLPICAAIARRAWPHPLVISSTILVLAGVAILSGFDWQTFRLGRGELETLLGSVFYAADILWLERAEFRHNDVSRMTFLMFGLTALVLLPFAALHAQQFSDLATVCATPQVLGLLAVLTVFCTLLSFTTMNAWQPHIEATHAGLIYCIEPVFASCFALFLPAWLSVLAHVDYSNEIASRHLIIGGALITLANVLMVLKPKAIPVPVAA